MDEIADSEDEKFQSQKIPQEINKNESIQQKLLPKE